MNPDAICKVLRMPESQRPAFRALLLAMEERERDRSDDPGDVPADITPERRAIAGSAIESFVADSGRRTARVMDGSLLDLLMSRGKINSDHYTAGAQFYSDWYHGGLANSGVIDPAKERVDGGTHKPQADEQLAALWSFVRAVTAIGPFHADPIIALVCFEEDRVSYVRRKFGVAREQTAHAIANSVLLVALAALVDHYQGPPRSTKRRTRSSHVDGYRPRIVVEGD